MEGVLADLTQWLLSGIGTLIAAGLILIVGWLIAWIVSTLVRRWLDRAQFDNRIAAWISEEEGEPIPIERWVARGVFWTLFIFVLVAFFEVLGLRVASEPLSRILVQISLYIPRLIGAGLLLFIGWIVASILRWLVYRVLKAGELGERLRIMADMEEEYRLRLAKALADTVYWLILLLFLPAVLGALDLQGLLVPFQAMFAAVLVYLPRIFASLVILGVGWLLARIVQRLVTSLLVAVGADQWSERVGVAPMLGKQQLSGAVGLLCFALVLVPVVIASLDALALDALTDPATDMLSRLLLAVPAFIGAGVLLGIAYVVGRWAARMTADVLAGLGFDRVLAILGLTKEPIEGQLTPSEIAGYLVLVGTMLLASIEACNLLGFTALATMLVGFTVFLLQVILGLVIFGFGLWLANFAAQLIMASSAAYADLLALAARVCILVLAGAMALTEMGLANSIVILAFGLLLAAVGLAVALAFGLGGRELAARTLDEWTKSLRSRK
jgi:hypothetical protein